MKQTISHALTETEFLLYNLGTESTGLISTTGKFSTKSTILLLPIDRLYAETFQQKGQDRKMTSEWAKTGKIGQVLGSGALTFLMRFEIVSS